MFLTGLGIFSTLPRSPSAMAGSAANALRVTRRPGARRRAPLPSTNVHIVTSTFQLTARGEFSLAAWCAVGGAGASIGVPWRRSDPVHDWRTSFYVNLPRRGSTARPPSLPSLYAFLPAVKASLFFFLYLNFLLPSPLSPPPRRRSSLRDHPGARRRLGFLQPHVCGNGGLAGLAAFAIYELLHLDDRCSSVSRIARPSLPSLFFLVLILSPPKSV